MKSICLKLSAMLAALVLSAAAGAQAFPTKPVRIIVPFPPGGAVDQLARVVAPKLADAFKHPVLVENRTGAGGNLGADAVAKSAPDGHTILMTPNGLAISPILYRQLPFDPARDFAAVTQLVDSRQVLTARPNLGVSSTRELIALAKAKPGALNYGTAGVGNALHLNMEMFKAAAGVDILAIPYKGEQQIALALLADEVDVAVLPFSATLVAHFKNGRLRPLGFTSLKRSPRFPDIPAISEAVPGFEAGSWQGFFVPARTPRPIINQIAGETIKALQMADVREHILAGGGRDIVGSTPEEFDALFKADLAKFARIGKEARIPFQD